MAHIQLVGVSEQKSPDNKIWKFPYAFPVIISGLQQTHHTFDLIDTHLHKKTSKELLTYLLECDSNIYGISGWSHNYLLVKEIINKIKQKKPNSIIIVGGILSGNHEVLINHTEVDIVATGAEGEIILPKILDAIDSNNLYESLKDIDGVVFRENGNMFVTNKHKVMTKAAFREYPFPAYDYFDKELKEMVSNINSRDDVKVKGFQILTMRGCPFTCTFCGHMYGKKFLRKKWNKFFDEVEILIENYGITGLFSNDTNMFLNEEDVDKFCNLYKERKSTFLGCYELRTTFGDKAMFEKLYNHGTRVILFGFESGSQYMLERMQKGFNLQTMQKVIKDAVDANLLVHGNFIFGTPGENKITINETKEFMYWLEELKYQQTVKFNTTDRHSISGYGKSILIPSPTSELYNICIQKGLIKNEEEYLINLSDEAATELLEGSSFKIALAEMGGNVNMSEFSSIDSMKCYVAYIEGVISLRVKIYLEKKYFNTKTVSCFFAMSKKYLNYLSQITKDKIKGEQRFFDKERAKKYLDKFPYLINKYNYEK